MNETKKPNRILIGAFAFIFILALVMGYYLGRGRGSAKIADAQATISDLEVTVKDLNEAADRAKLVEQQLREIHEADTERIGGLEATNSGLADSYTRTAKLIEQQRLLIVGITSGNREAGNSSSEITSGLNEAIESIDSLIEDIQAGED